MLFPVQLQSLGARLLSQDAMLKSQKELRVLRLKHFAISLGLAIELNMKPNFPQVHHEQLQPVNSSSSDKNDLQVEVLNPSHRQLVLEG